MLLVGLKPDHALQKNLVEEDARMPAGISPMADLNVAIRRWERVHIVRVSEIRERPSVVRQ